jgi:hypothetical protein
MFDFLFFNRTPNYLILNREEYLLKTKREEVLNDIHKEDVYPVFIQLLDKPFSLWIIELNEAENDVLIYYVDLVPKNVTDVDINNKEKLLTKIINKIVKSITDKENKWKL